MSPVARSLRCLMLSAMLPLVACGRGGAPAPAVTGYPDFADLVEQVSPAVVNISTVVDAAPASSAQDELQPDALEGAPEWFRRFFERQFENERAEEGLMPDQESLGSGFILWEDGYILTNYHVIRGAKEVIVRLLDRRQFTAKLVGSDEASDLALLHIDAKNLPVVKLGDSRKLRPGQWVLAIGSPFGFDYSVTAGIVSAKGRALVTEQYVPFIQTDVAINPGNSGGPLFNLAGEVVGVNSQIYSQSGGYQGVSFSIPIDVAAKVARQLRDTGTVTRGWLGVVVQEVDRDLAQQFGMDKAEGALVARVLPDSPAEKAGLREGDVILRYNGEPLPSSSSLPHMVGITDPGEIATLDIVRGGKPLTLKIEVGTLRAEPPPGAAPPPATPPGEKLGLSVRPLTDEERRFAQVVGGGLMITEVRDGPAARAGVRPGDVLIQLAGQEVDSVSRYREVVDRLTPGQTVAVLVQRRGAPLFLALDVPAPAPAGSP
ncbi:serine protease Do [Fontimonas thermophila]|uniref:Probable periplasmic serine endoprotease DegP-like n=1 Tax=Fontimonas thermophila TaxID=1076937 RepID=A0A1I2JKX6_9GAMM|nr:DegQ family serine endoprotease [Fontimonas thermophila]SFF55214.1 serine protease Do [Fontimonas thermophila]